MTDTARRETLFRELRQALMLELEEQGEQTDEEVQARIDALIQERSGRESLSLRLRENLYTDLFNSVRKLDILQELVDDTEVTEIMINGWKNVFYEKQGRILRWDKSFASPERLEDVIQEIAGSCNRIVNEQRPIADARLSNGARVNIVLPPVSLEGPILTIRRFPDDPITMDRLVAMGSLTREAALFLRRLVEARYSILVGGGTSTGKTTFLNALSAYIPAAERIVTIEDNAELQLQGIPNLVRLEAREANIEGASAVSIRDLIRTALRMRPDRIIIGEIRGAEAGDFLVCLNTGHDGSMGSAHANSVSEMTLRLQTMSMMSDMKLSIPVIKRQITAGVEILVHLSRTPSGARRLEEVAEIIGMEGEEIAMHTLFRRDEAGRLVRSEALQHTEKWERIHGRVEN